MIVVAGSVPKELIDRPKASFLRYSPFTGGRVQECWLCWKKKYVVFLVGENLKERKKKTSGTRNAGMRTFTLFVFAIGLLAVAANSTSYEYRHEIIDALYPPEIVINETHVTWDHSYSHKAGVIDVTEFDGTDGTRELFANKSFHGVMRRSHYDNIIRVRSRVFLEYTDPAASSFDGYKTHLDAVRRGENIFVAQREAPNLTAFIPDASLRSEDIGAVETLLSFNDKGKGDEGVRPSIVMVFDHGSILGRHITILGFVTSVTFDFKLKLWVVGIEERLLEHVFHTLHFEYRTNILPSVHVDHKGAIHGNEKLARSFEEQAWWSSFTDVVSDHIGRLKQTAETAFSAIKVAMEAATIVFQALTTGGVTFENNKTIAEINYNMNSSATTPSEWAAEGTASFRAGFAAKLELQMFLEVANYEMVKASSVLVGTASAFAELKLEGSLVGGSNAAPSSGSTYDQSASGFSLSTAGFDSSVGSDLGSSQYEYDSSSYGAQSASSIGGNDPPVDNFTTEVPSLAVRSFDEQAASDSSDDGEPGQGDSSSGFSQRGSVLVTTIVITPITVMLGVIPMTIKPSVPITVGYELIVAAEFDWNPVVQATGIIRAGFEYTPDAGFQVIADKDFSLKKDLKPPNLAVRIFVDTYVEATLMIEIAFLGQIAPALRIGAQMTGIYSSDPAAECVLSINVNSPITMNIGATLKVAIGSVKIWEQTFGPKPIYSEMIPVTQLCIPTSAPASRLFFVEATAAQRLLTNLKAKDIGSTITAATTNKATGVTTTLSLQLVRGGKPLKFSATTAVNKSARGKAAPFGVGLTKYSATFVGTSLVLERITTAGSQLAFASNATAKPPLSSNITAIQDTTTGKLTIDSPALPPFVAAMVAGKALTFAPATPSPPGVNGSVRLNITGSKWATALSKNITGLALVTQRWIADRLACAPSQITIESLAVGSLIVVFSLDYPLNITAARATMGAATNMATLQAAYTLLTGATEAISVSQAVLLLPAPTFAPITKTPTTTSTKVPISNAPGTTISTKAPATALISNAPGTTISTKAPATAPISNAPGTTISTKAPATAPISNAPGTTISTKAPVTAPISNAPGTTTSTKAPVAVVTPTPTAAPVVVTLTVDASLSSAALVQFIAANLSISTTVTTPQPATKAVNLTVLDSAAAAALVLAANTKNLPQIVNGTMPSTPAPLATATVAPGTSPQTTAPRGVTPIPASPPAPLACDSSNLTLVYVLGAVCGVITLIAILLSVALIRAKGIATEAVKKGVPDNQLPMLQEGAVREHRQQQQLRPPLSAPHHRDDSEMLTL